VVVRAAVVVVATAAVVVTGALAPEAPPGDDANELTGQASTLTATSASAAAPRRLPLVQGRPAVATFPVVLISVGNSTTVRGPCTRRTEERYPESRPCLLFRGTTGRYGRHGNYAGFCRSPVWVLPRATPDRLGHSECMAMRTTFTAWRPVELASVSNSTGSFSSRCGSPALREDY
jgi:hypothetical protein